MILLNLIKLNSRKSISIFSLVALLLIIGAFVLIPAFTGILKEKKINTYKISFTNPLNFSYSPDKIIINSSGARLSETNSKSLIETSTPIIISKDTKLLGFKEIAEKNGNTDISYRITTSNNSWYYFDGNSWRTVPETCRDCTNNAREIDQNIKTLPIESTNLRINTYLSSSYNSVPVLKSIDLLMQGNESKQLYAEKPNYKFQSSLASEGSDGCQCKDYLKILKLRYTGPSGVTINVYEEDHHKNLLKSFSNVSSGDILILSGSAKGDDRMKDKLFFEIPDSGIADISQYTKCDKVNLNLVFGNFTIIGYTDKESNICEGSSNNQPVINSDSATTPKNVAVIVNVLANDSDPSGILNPATVTVTTNPTNGTITNINNTTGEITYTPNNDYTGSDIFTYQVCNNSQVCSTANVTINISGSGSGSIIDGKKDSFYSNPIPQCFIGVPAGTLYTYLDTSGNLYIYYEQDKNVVDNTYGTNIINWPRSHSFSDLVGSDGAQFNIKDSLGNTIMIFNSDYISSSSVPSKYSCLGVSGGEGSITVGSAANILGAKTSIDYNLNILGCALTTNSPPADNSYNPTDGSCPSWIFEDSYEIGISKNAFGVNGFGSVDVVYVHDSSSKLGTNKIIPEPCGGPSCGNGNLELGEKCDDGNLQNGDGCSSTCQFEVNRKPPVAKNDKAKTFQDEPVNIDVLANDSDPDGNIDPTTVVVTTNPSHGTVSVDLVTGEVTYTPETGFSGKDKFYYTVKDNGGLVSNIAEVKIDVDKNPSSCGCYKYLTKLVLRYNGTQSAVIKVIKEKGTTPYFEGSVNPDGQITIYNNGASLGDSIEVYINGILNATFDTDCDADEITGKETEVGLVVGLMEVMSGASYKGVPLCSNVINLPPIANNDSATTLKNTPVTINVLTNDSDPDGMLVPSTVSVTINPAHGTVNINNVTGAITYTPANNYTGIDTFTYQVCDNDGLCDTAIVTVTVNAIPLPPVANDDIDTTTKNTPSTIDILSNDYGVSGTLIPSSVIIISNPAHGMITNINPVNGVVTYTPNNNFTGIDTFIYNVCDTNSLCDTATVTININANPLPPIANNDSTATVKNNPVVTNVLNNDSDPDGYLVSSTVTVTINPTNGTITNINSTTGEITYTPNNNYTGTDTFTYQVCDNDGLCDTAIVTITIEKDKVPICHRTDTDNESDPYIFLKVDENQLLIHLTHVIDADHTRADIIPITDRNGDGNINVDDCNYIPNLPPIANNDATNTNEDVSVLIDVLLNDIALTGTLVPSSVIITINPANGTIISIDPLTGKITYTPNPGYNGTDTFTYQVCDSNGLCDTATVTVNVIGTNLPPVANNDSVSTIGTNPVEISVLNNDSDPDGTLNPASVIITTLPSNGIVTNINPLNGNITYIANPGFYGTDNFIYQVCDNEGLCTTATVSITVKAKPIAENDAAFTNKNTPVIIDILSNDSTPSGSLVPSSVIITSDPSNGNVTVDSSTGKVTYTPLNNFTGVDSFEYQVCNTYDLCDTAIVNIGVESKLPPIANDDFSNTNQNTPVEINILNNDNAPSGTLNPATVNITSNPSNGTTTIDTVTGKVTYNPNPGFYGTDTFTYLVKDSNNLESNIATVTVNVKAPPIANNDSASTAYYTPITIDILNNDLDPDGTLIPSTVTIISNPSHGKITVDNLTGKVYYVPDAGYYGDDVFSYKVKDNDGFESNIAFVTITVRPPGGCSNCGPTPQPPVAVADNTTTNKNQSVAIDILSNDFDTDGFIVNSSVTIVSDPKNGTIINIDPLTGKVTYLPNTDFTGVDTFVYKILDNSGLSSTALVTITINPKIPPVAKDDSSATAINTPVIIDILNNDSDPDGTLNNGSVQIISSPTNGTITNIDPTTGKVTYLPNPGFNEIDKFIYKVKDNDGLDSNPANVIIGIGTILPPIANDDTKYTNPNTPISIDVLINDSAPSGTLLPNTVKVIQNPLNGTITNINPANGIIEYTPNTGFIGQDSFIYEVCDNNGLCDTATVTIKVGINLPPIANNDAVTTAINTPIVIDVLVNDSDPDGTLDPTTTKLITPPVSGIINNINILNGNTTYTPNFGFAGVDTFTYEICDNDGLCSSALVTITVLAPPPAVIIINPEYCNGRVYTAPDIGFVGTITNVPNSIAAIQYSLDGGTTWIPVATTPAAAAPGGLYTFNALGLPNGVYTALARSISTAGVLVTSPICNFSVALEGLIFGANQFVTIARSAPLSNSGVIQFVENTPQTFYLEAKGATTAYVEAIPTTLTTNGKTSISEVENPNSIIFPLIYNSKLKLWTGNIGFEKSGFYRLIGHIANSRESYSREINTVFVSVKSNISDADTGQPINNVSITVFEKNANTGNFEIWNAESYGQQNPLNVSENGNFSIFLPTGEFYLKVEALGYNSVTSLITKVDSYGIATANIKMKQNTPILNRIFSSRSKNNASNNFPVIITAMPIKEFLQIGETVPDIELTDKDGNQFSMFSKLEKKPTIIMVYSSWNTLAQEQPKIFDNVSIKLGDKYNYIPISTMEPNTTSLTYKKRGAYLHESYKPNDQFFEDYMIISLPHFFILDENNKLIGNIVGPQAETDLITKIENIIGK